MLALYENCIEAPNEMKQFEQLYNAREKPPLALNAFEDDGVSAFILFYLMKTNNVPLPNNSGYKFVYNCRFAILTLLP